MELEQSVEKLRRRLQYQRKISASFPEPRLCNIEPDHIVCDDTSRRRRWNWRMELEGVKHMEQDKEQHGEQGKVEDIGGEI